MDSPQFYALMWVLLKRLILGKCRIRAERHVTGGITCRTAYIHDPRVKGHPKKIFLKIKKNKQKKLFKKKKLLPNDMLRCSDGAEPS